MSIPAELLVYVDPEVALSKGRAVVGWQYVALPDPLRPRKEGVKDALHDMLVGLLRWQSYWLKARGEHARGVMLGAYVTPLEDFRGDHLPGRRWWIEEAAREPAKFGAPPAKSYAERQPTTTAYASMCTSPTGTWWPSVDPARYTAVHDKPLVEATWEAVEALLVQRIDELAQVQDSIDVREHVQRTSSETEGQQLLVEAWARLCAAGPTSLIVNGVVQVPVGYDPTDPAHRLLVAAALDLTAPKSAADDDAATEERLAVETSEEAEAGKPLTDVLPTVIG